MTKQTITWMDAQGTSIDLTNGEHYDILKGVKGLYMPPVEAIEEESPFQHGSQFRQMNVKARELDVPLLIKGKDEKELLQAIRQLLRMVNPLKGEGKFKVSNADGSQRELNCRYMSGFEMEEADETKGRNWQKAIGVFRAFDPFWYDTITNVQTFTTGQPATFFPFFPLRLASSTVFADTTIDNIGDVETYPEWIITGPCENIVLRNLTTGEQLHLETSLQIGESITIDTKKKTIKKHDGANLFATQTEESSLWALQEGKNNIRIEMGNSDARSSVQLSYKNRYWGP